ncbi:hypothetical protein H9Y04_29685 [Streptomyces sp. TRM66268-LWL]|uniref:PqqD family protein n=1 Tax=Streptomyces polyasparticus TaxID=2767826 RepID=A0ABR7SQW5_9ACTN|nr:hypothetical protein [Streptomyces polyasparticus]MBC9716713.1 hypothetical protein [Streptomyces polyasparticus]
MDDPTGPTTVRLHPLACRSDRDEWIVGRMATGQFVALPEVGKRVIDLLQEGLSVPDVGVRLRQETGEDLDVREFVTALMDLEFVAEADGLPVPAAPPEPPPLSRVRPRHVRWTLHPALPVTAAVLVAAALVLLGHRRDLSLDFRTLLWSSHGSLVIALHASAGWALLLLHETAHLLTARATGVPGHIGLGTRLQFLVLQTDISGIELAPRRHRLTAYLAGIAVNLTAFALAVLGAAAVQPGTLPHRVLLALALTALLPLPFQLMVFMRTDLYFVLQDLTGCRDLYGDGVAYAAYLGRRLLRRPPRPGSPDGDPSALLPRHERRAVRIYTVVLVVGTAACLAFLAAITLPADLTLLSGAASGLVSGHSAAATLDAAAVLVFLGGLHILWAVTWLRNRRRK